MGFFYITLPNCSLHSRTKCGFLSKTRICEKFEMKHSHVNRCIINTAEGLAAGLSHFSPPSRVALIYALTRNDPLCIYDPQNIFGGHEPRLKELFLNSSLWKENVLDSFDKELLTQIKHENYMHPLSGIVSFCGQSRALFLQMWCTEQHPDICCIGPTERWLEYAARLLSRNVAAKRMLDLGTSDYVLREYAMHAVRDHIVDERNRVMGLDTHLRIFPILDAILGISKTREEGSWPRGKLVFVEPDDLRSVRFVARFSSVERPELQNAKHTRKMLMTVEDSDRKLISDGSHILGISRGEMPKGSLCVDFRGGYGFLNLDADPVCSFSDGAFSSTTRKANLVYLEEFLLETDLDSPIRDHLFSIAAKIVQEAGAQKFGCTIVIDLNNPPLPLPGQKLEPPIDLTQDDLLELAQSMAKIDGALHVAADLKLHAFSCLLDGLNVTGENRARGARYNSALRFSHAHPDVIVVVVSSDRPVSVIQGGVELAARCERLPLPYHMASPPTLEEWIAR